MAELVFTVESGRVHLEANNAKMSDMAATAMYAVHYLAEEEKCTPQEMLDRMRTSFNEIATAEE